MTNQEYEAEIARLTQGYESLKEWCDDYREFTGESYTRGYNAALVHVLDKINKITGGEK